MEVAKAGGIELEAGSNAASVADALARTLQGAIVSGELPVGSSLPSERELMVKYSVSRTSVREALRILGAQGLLQVKRGRSGGSFITSPTPNFFARSLDLFIKGQDMRFVDLVFAREAIEPFAAAQAALFRTERELDELRSLCVRCEETLYEVARFVDVNLDWHLAVAQASHNPLFVAFITSISSALHTATELEEFDLKTRKSVVGVHWQIFNAIQQGDADAAKRRMARHVSAYGERLSSINLPQTFGNGASPD